MQIQWTVKSPPGGEHMLYPGHSVDYTRLTDCIYQCSGHNSFHHTYLLSESQSSVGVKCELSGSSWNIFYVFYEIFLFLFTDTAQWMCLLWSVCSVSRWCLSTFLDYLHFKTDPSSPFQYQTLLLSSSELELYYLQSSAKGFTRAFNLSLRGRSLKTDLSPGDWTW